MLCYSIAKLDLIMRNWDLQSKISFSEKNFNLEKLQKILLVNRGIKTKEDIKYFLDPDLESLTVANLGIDGKQLLKAVKRIREAIKKKEMIVVFGDYDVDGICGSAILWEALNSLKANAMPYIPHRIEEGYGLSKKGIENLKLQYPDTKLIITVDNGIVANESVDFANSLGIDVVITDHHTLGKEKPKAFAIVHSTKICGAAVSWFLSKQIKNNKSNLKSDDHLGLVALATVADVMKLTQYNRVLLVHGLPVLRETKRPGLVALTKVAAIEQNKIGVYEIGHIIGPRINASGRIDHAMDSLRLLCTKDPKRAKTLSEKLNATNLDRKKITLDALAHAKTFVEGRKIEKLLFVSHESYEPGVIGLIAGRLTEEYYRPSIVISIGEVYSKASARSVSGFNIIEFIRLSSHLLVDAGGHPGAAGFTVETSKLLELQTFLEREAKTKIAKELLVRRLAIDCELELPLVSDKLFSEIQKHSPFGYGNPEPTFLAKNVLIENIRIVGADQKHLKIELKTQSSEFKIGGILFNYDQTLGLSIGDKVNIVYAISQNEWNGSKKLELKIKDIS